MNIDDFKNQVLFCQRFNSQVETITVHQLHTFLNDYYKKLLHLKRDLTISAYSKSVNNNYNFLSSEILQDCIDALLQMNYSHCFSPDNEEITSYLIGNCISALKGIVTSWNKLRLNSQSITFEADQQHKSKILSLKENALNKNL
ncbi:MAG: hypothetical protein ACTTJH_03820 [Bacteroidales bacterium]